MQSAAAMLADVTDEPNSGFDALHKELLARETPLRKRIDSSGEYVRFGENNGSRAKEFQAQRL